MYSNISIAMNQFTFLFNEDVDLCIISHLTPPSVLRLTQVNMHFRHTLAQQQSEFNKVRIRFGDACQYGYLWIAKWIRRKYENILKKSCSRYFLQHSEKNFYGNGFAHACAHNHIDVAKWILSLGVEVNIHFFAIYYNRDLFEVVCNNGHLKIAQLLLDTFKYIDIHSDWERVFRLACYAGHIDVAKWIIKIGETTYGRINIHIMEDASLRAAISQGNFDIAIWLIEIGKQSYGEFELDDATKQLIADYSAKKLIDSIT